MLDKFQHIIRLIRNADTRWEGLVHLKALKSKPVSQYLWRYVNDEDWMIRCSVIDKIADLGQAKYAEKLITKLTDRDPVVQLTTKDAIKRLTEFNLRPLFKLLKHPDRMIREFCVSVVRSRVKTHLPQIVKGFSTESWIPANRLLHIVWVELGTSSEKVLLKALTNKKTQRHAIMMLAILQSKAAISHFVSFYSVSALRRHIVQAILEMDREVVFPELMEFMKVNSTEDSIRRIIRKIGQPMLPYVIDNLGDEQLQPLLIPLLKEFILSERAVAQIKEKVGYKVLIEAEVSMTDYKLLS